jgi:hypothetical protein
MEIEIVGIPDGEAPLEIREQWVGLVLPVTSGVCREPRGVVTGKVLDYYDGYRVKDTVAIDILYNKSREAGQWWKDNYLSKYVLLPGHHYPPVIANTFLIFEKEVCQIV